MINFERRFQQTKGEPFEEDGVVYRVSLTLDAGIHEEVVLTFESTSSLWRQGIHLESEQPLEMGRRKGQRMVIWEDVGQTPVHIVCQPHSTLHIWNVWDTGDGTTHSCHAGAAMIAEGTQDGYRLHCNDGHMDADFDDLIFTIGF